jgi:hypothetical protein
MNNNITIESVQTKAYCVSSHQVTALSQGSFGFETDHQQKTTTKQTLDMETSIQKNTTIFYDNTTQHIRYVKQC